MKEVTHIRKGHLILTASGAPVMDCKTINAAKRQSRHMQKHEGAVIRAETYKRQYPSKQMRKAAPTRLQRIRAAEQPTVTRAKKKPRRPDWRRVADDALVRGESE